MDDQNPHEKTKSMRHFFDSDFTLSKRQLGIILVIAGVICLAAILALDLVGGGREGGIGPAQRAALVFMASVTVFGATLIPLGDDPA